jgi:hypothetical protein
VRSPRSIDVETTNVTAFEIDMPADAGLLEPGRPVTVTIGREAGDAAGTETAAIAVTPAADNRLRATFTAVGGGWRQDTAAAEAGLRKRPGLQGPIDDAFMDAFLFVGPVSMAKATPAAPATAADTWAAAEYARATREWRRQFRGDIVARAADAVTADDIATRHLVLFGTPESNPLVAKVLPQLPLRRDGGDWVIGSARAPAATSIPLLVHPNPLNPARYVVLNSGFTFRDYASLNNARQIPMLPDWALVSTVAGRGSELPGTILADGFFDERWLPR